MLKIVAVLLLITSCADFINGQFSKNLDNLNVDMILKNDRILSSYLKCLLDKGEKLLYLESGCSNNYVHLKRHF